MKKTYSVTVRGRENTWTFNFEADEQYVSDWRDDGLVIDEILNTIPLWIQQLGLTRPWCFIQDVFNFRNPFK